MLIHVAYSDEPLRVSEPPQLTRTKCALSKHTYEAINDVSFDVKLRGSVNM